MTTTLTARSPEDVLAVVPLVLGFSPTDSVVMLTFGGATTFHARVDLPEVGEPVDPLVESLREPALRHGVREVFFVIYSADGAARGAALPAAGPGLPVGRDHGLRRAACRRRAVAPTAAVPPRGAAGRGALRHLRPPFLVSSVVEGQVTHRSREALAATLDAEPARVRSVEEARTGSPVTAGWVRSVVERHVAACSVPDDAEAAALLQALAVPDLRDAAWSPLRRETAQQSVAFWSDLVRRAPDDLVSHVAAVLGFAAWVAGHGALAWCAVDRSHHRRPRPLAGAPGRRPAGLGGAADRLGGGVRPAGPRLNARLRTARTLRSGHGRGSRGTGVLPR